MARDTRAVANIACMSDILQTPTAEWGLCPVIHIGSLHATSYAVTMVLAFAAAFLLFRRNARRAGVAPGQPLPVLLAALAGGILGAKIPIWLTQIPSWLHGQFRWNAFFSGRTVAGGLLGGLLAVWIVKHRLGIRTRYGNLLAPSIALGMVIGRIGCLLSGCCHGTPTALPWGIDFGDGNPRHPTQLYEILFLMPAFAVLQLRLPRATPGRLLTGFFATNFALRFLEEFIRPNPRMAGLTEFQWICLVGLAWLGVKEFVWFRRAINHKECG